MQDEASLGFNAETLATRTRKFSTIVYILTASLTLVSFTINGDFAFFIAVLTVVGCGFAARRQTKDLPQFLLLTHPSLTYVATTLLYGITSGNFGMDLMFDRTLAFSIVAFYQLALLVAWAFARVIPLPTPRNGEHSSSRGRHAFMGMIFFGGLYLATQFLPSLRQVEVFSLSISALFAYYTALLATRQNRPRPRLAAFSSLAMMGVISVAGNSRTAVFVMLLFWLFYLAGLRHRVFTLRNMAIGLASIIAINVLTASVIGARAMRDDVDPATLMAETLRIALSPETLLASLPFSGSEDTPVIDPSRVNTQYFSPFLRGPKNDYSADISFAGRLAMLAHMDIVTGRLGFIEDPKWNDIASTYTSALPDFGQTKVLNWSDQLVWSLALRDRSTAASPLITPAGELYIMGGFWGFVPLTVAVFFPIFIGLRLLRASLGEGFPYTGVGVTILYSVTFTGTALAAVSLELRTLPIVLGWLYLTRASFVGTSSRHLSPAR